MRGASEPRRGTTVIMEESEGGGPSEPTGEGTTVAQTNQRKARMRGPSEPGGGTTVITEEAEGVGPSEPMGGPPSPSLTSGNPGFADPVNPLAGEQHVAQDGGGQPSSRKRQKEADPVNPSAGEHHAAQADWGEGTITLPD